MHALTHFPTYVPKHVNRDNIAKCFVDKDTNFIDVETVQEAVEREAASTDPFFVFETDHFIFYNSPEGIVKCSYLARNFILGLPYPIRRDSWDQKMHVQDGLKVYRNPPILLFAPTGMSSDVYYSGILRHSVIIPYEAVGFDRFAQTVKEMAGCDQRFFVVAYGDRYECIDTENTDNRAEYTTEEMYIFVRQTSESFASLKRKLEQAQLRKANFPSRLPNGQFKLSDYLGSEVIDGEEFRLTRDLENYHSYYSDEGRGDSNEDGRKPRYDGIVIVEDFMMLYPEDDAIFTSETIEGIVYLKYGEQYVYCPDDHDFAIELTQELPDKSERLHMEYDGNALIFSHWDKFGYAYEEFLDHKGYIDFAEGEDLCFGNDNMQLHIVKL